MIKTGCGAVHLTGSGKTNAPAMNPRLTTTVLALACLLENTLNAALIEFSFTAQKPFQRTNSTPQSISIRLQFTISDPGNQAEHSASALKAGKTLSIDEHADALKWFLSRSQFVLAEHHALALVEKTRSNHIGALISLAFSRVCRGDYETACKTFEMIDRKGGPPGLRPWYVYLKSVTLSAAESVESLAKSFVESGEVSVNPMAMTAVLATCAELKNGQALFKMLERSTTPFAISKDEDNIRTFAELKVRYGAGADE